MIHICYAIYNGNNKYHTITGTSMVSLLENTQKEITVHLLHDNTLSDDIKNGFSKMFDNYQQHIIFYNIDNLNVCNMNYFQELGKSIKFSPATFYRFIMHQIIPNNITKIIYLDSDTIINLDIEELWNIDINNYFLAAVPNLEVTMFRQMLSVCRMGLCKFKNYFNAGVMLINLQQFRENCNDLLTEAISMLQNYNLTFYDQDIYNIKFSTQYYKLPRQFNVGIHSDLIGKEFESKIYHYLFSVTCQNKGRFIKLWHNYYNKYQLLSKK